MAKRAVAPFFETASPDSSGVVHEDTKVLLKDVFKRSHTWRHEGSADRFMSKTSTLSPVH